MSKYFKESEFTYSTTARKHNIDNTPTEEAKKNINTLMEFLDGVREAWGSPIIVSSGYRCEELNNKVGGSKNSGHKYGWAGDLIPSNNKKREFFEFFKEYVKDKSFDELILEKSGKSIWIHFSLYSYQGKQRKKIKEIEK